MEDHFLIMDLTKLCVKHICAKQKVLEAQVTDNSLIVTILTNDEIFCLRSCSGYNPKCPKYENVQQYFERTDKSTYRRVRGVH